MQKLKTYPLWLSLGFGITFFAAIYPYNHNMYIGWLHTLICAVLNAGSAILFSVILYNALHKRFPSDTAGGYFWFLLLLGVGHGVFAFMNWGSWVCLAISAGVLVWMIVAGLRKNKA